LNHQLVCHDCGYEHNRKSDSWLLQDIVIWNKTRALPYNNEGQFRNVFEYILCFSKTDSFEFDVDETRIADPNEFKQWWVEYPERYHPRGKVPDNIWEHVTPSQGSFGSLESLDHPAPFPTGLVERILRLTTESDSVVLDPFAGSGTVPAVADIMDRRSIGFELSSEYCDAYPDVKEEITEKYGDRLRSETSRQQEQLARVIGGLRQLKHAKELLREHKKNESALAQDGDLVHTAFHHCKELDVTATGEGNFIQSAVHYIVDDDVQAETISNLEQSLRSIAANGISASYGIAPDVNVHTTTEFFEFAGSDNEFSGIEDLYIYEDGRHYTYTEQIDLSNWMERTMKSDDWQQEFAGEEWVPIVSNVGLSLSNPRRQDDMESTDDGDGGQLEIHGIENRVLS
jgi:hypothetical protein